MRFFGLFRAKMTTIGIQDPKLIVTNYYQQLLAQLFKSPPALSMSTPEAPMVGLRVDNLSRYFLLIIYLIRKNKSVSSLF